MCCDDLVCRITDIMDITSEDFVNKNLYEFCHAEDLQKLHKAHVDCKCTHVSPRFTSYGQLTL